MSNNYEIIPKPAIPPKEWKAIRPELLAKKSAFLNLSFAFLILVFGLASALIANLSSGWVLSVLILCLTVLLSAHSLKWQPDNSYGLYATWIFQTVPPTTAMLELTKKFVGEYGDVFYKVRVIDGDEEEIYDIKTIFPFMGSGGALSDRLSEAQVYRDPVNQQCVVAQVGETIVWLWEFTPF